MREFDIGSSIPRVEDLTLLPLGIRHFEMPATPARLWRAIREAKGN